ncbi:MAG: hypothetical protein HQ564_02575 [Candidatus Saganbacteria bacterium]|nr:hypothetical protein [Candidatus Saganbacteria bacterium]
MGLIKRSQIKETGEVFLKKEPIIAPAPPVVEERFLDDDERENLEESNKDQAQNIVSQAQAESASVRAAAKKQGLEEGREEGRAESQEKIKEALETVNQAVKARKKILKDSEAEILRLALKAAEQIIRSEVSLHRDVCLNIVSEAINRVSDREQVIVRVNHEDAEYIKKHKDRLSGIVDGIRSFSILEDNQIEPGGCIIETNLGYIDARISTKIESIEEAFNRISASEKVND